jgi:transcription initiation factor TFIID subunit 1
VIFDEGVEYEIRRDDQAIFNRTSKADKLRWKMEQMSTSKRRKVDMEMELDDHFSSGSEDIISMNDSDEEIPLVSHREKLICVTNTHSLLL